MHTVKHGINLSAHLRDPRATFRALFFIISSQCFITKRVSLFKAISKRYDQSPCFFLLERYRRELFPRLLVDHQREDYLGMATVLLCGFKYQPMQSALTTVNS